MKINSALETIRLLSKSKEVQNLPIEELEQKLRNATALLREENFLDGNITDTPELTTELLSTMKNFIFYSTRTTPAQQKSTVSHSTTPSLKTVKTTQAFTFDTSPTTSSSISFFKRRNNSSISYSNVNSRKRGNTRITSTAITPSEDSTTSFTTISTTPSPSTSTLSPTIASTTVLKNIFTKTLTTPSTTTSVKAKSVATSNSPKPTTTFELKFEIVTSTSASTSIVTPATVSLFSEEHNEVNYTPDASSVSFVKLSHNKNNTKVVMSPPPNPLSIEELQYLLESNRKDVKRQQPQEESSTSSTTASIDAGSTQNISSTEDSSSISNISKTSDSDNTIVISSSENSSASSTTTSGNSDNSNGITEESSIKVDDTSDNNAPLEALADSFGGENEEQVDSWQANAKPNGVYFLLDWNTFLSVGEEDKRPIRIRFSPRAGNPRNFMPIKVP
ncbi:hypothetical protein V9T40_002727 [Parthenolecanium corni]|uniref:Cell wall protein DAN4 n=1 Tax=Parthenolecanium corni TaxID=536013 RepID=A0AAN9TIY2_9HEMI